jgi:peptide/nickel transport system permease protein
VRYLAWRLGHGVLLLLGVSLLSFVFFELAPGDYFDEMRLDPRVSPETVEALRAQYGLDRPFRERYLTWLASTLRGEMGYSFAYRSPAGPLIWQRAWRTLALSGAATALAWLLAVPLGIGWATRRGRRGDTGLGLLSSTFLAVPDILLALCLLLLAVRTSALPTGGMASVGFAELGRWAQAKDLASHLALPVAALVLGSLPLLVRHVRASMVEVLDAPFIRAARAHGIPGGRLLFRHALPAAANPLISLFGLSLASLLSGSILIEVVFSWPGLGPLLLEAILARDLHLVVGAVVVSTLFLVGGNLLADVLLYTVDPRIRAGSRS